MFRAVIFDFDGVLVDSEPWWERADARLVEAEGKKLDPEAKKAVIGLKQEVSIRKILELHGIRGDPVVFMRRREKMMEDYEAAAHADSVIESLTDDHLRDGNRVKDAANTHEGRGAKRLDP